MAIRRTPSSYPVGRRATLALIGDSLSHAISNGCRIDQMSTEVLAAKLRAIGCPLRGRNFAISGNTTTNMLARMAEFFVYDIAPTIAVIFGGVNDPGSSISDATTQSNIQAMVRYLRNGCKGTVSIQTSLPANANIGDRYVVTGDTSTTGGLNPSGMTYATLTGTHAGVQVWECRNSLASVSGWSRVTGFTGASAIVPKIIAVSPQFLNWTSGGDTVAAGSSHSGQNATYKAVNDDIAAACTAETVPFCDLYAYMQSLINAGRDTALSASWHVLGTNQHLNYYGQQVVAEAILATINAQSGWLAALQAL